MRPSRIRSLDGLRAISIVLVLLAHANGTQDFPVPYDVVRFFGLGLLGVHVFFVISGFLITYLLLREVATTGRIDLPRFYLRRTFRIFPPYYAFLAVVGAASVVELLQFAPGDLFHALTYTSNYHATRTWNVGHTWSLAVEEQFYLLWPAALILAGTRGGLRLAAVVVAIAPLLRLATWIFIPSLREGMAHRFEMVADSIAVGCLLAAADSRLREHGLYQRLLASRMFVVVPLVVLALSTLHGRPRVFAIASSLMDVGIALCVHRAVLHADGPVGRMLNARPVVWVGLMSYSLYIWQQLFLNRGSSAALTAFPLNIIMVFVAACLSYYLIERPALRYREKLETLLLRRPSARAYAVPSDALVVLARHSRFRRRPFEARLARRPRRAGIHSRPGALGGLGGASRAPHDD